MTSRDIICLSKRLQVKLFGLSTCMPSHVFRAHAHHWKRRFKCHCVCFQLFQKQAFLICNEFIWGSHAKTSIAAPPTVQCCLMSTVSCSSLKTAALTTLNCSYALYMGPTAASTDQARDCAYGQVRNRTSRNVI